MMHVTLNIISRTMFSSDSDDIVTIMGRSAGRYQAEMRPNIHGYAGLAAMACELCRDAESRSARWASSIGSSIDSSTSAHAIREIIPRTCSRRLIAARDEQTAAV